MYSCRLCVDENKSSVQLCIQDTILVFIFLVHVVLDNLLIRLLLSADQIKQDCNIKFTTPLHVLVYDMTG